jgi:hypothetical protein
MAAILWLVAMRGAAPAGALVVRTFDRVRVIDPSTGSVAATSIGGRVSPDGTAAVGALLATTGDTTVNAMRLSDGTHLWSRVLPGQMAVRLVSPGGERAVLAPGLGADQGGAVSYTPRAQRHTTLVVASATQARTYRLDGNFEPEALSSDGNSLFVIKFTPPMAPNQYQVRRLDLATGEVHDVYTPDEELQQSMGGRARTQAASSDGRRLYTLYRSRSADGGKDVFIHVLSLDELWAHCIHLPDGFSGKPGKTALAVSPDSTRLYVADSMAGRIAEIDTTALSVEKDVAAEVPPPAGYGSISATVTDDGGLVVGGYRTVRRFATQQRATMGIAGPTPSGWATEMTFTAPGEIVAVNAAGSGQVHVALTRRVLLIDSRDGTTLTSLAIPGRGPIAGIGVSPDALPDPRQGLSCAC